MPDTGAPFEIPFLDGTELVRDYPDFSEDLANQVADNLLIGTTSDGSNTALGDGAFTSNTTGSQNTAVGKDALENNTTGIRNTALGRSALASNTTGSDNTAVGRVALFNNTTGIRNTALGRSALASNTTGDDNTAVGRAAGDITTTGSNNLTLGFSADPSSATASDQVTLGNSSIATLRCQQTSITALSDIRDKADVEETTLGLEVINKLRPVEFTWQTRDGAVTDKPDIGFIAQDLAALEDELGEQERLRLTLRENPEKLEATPGRLIPILVKAVQELSDQNAELRARVEALEAK